MDYDYIDHHGNAQKFSEETEKKYAEQNKNWIVAQYFFNAVLIIMLYYGGIYLWRMLPR